MKNQAANTHHYYYDRATKAKIPVTEEVYAVLTEEATKTRKKEQYHRRCMCPRQFIWKCDGCCQDCEYHTAGETLSLDALTEDGGCSMHEILPDASVPMEKRLEWKELISRCRAKMHEIDPDAEVIFSLWENNGHISDREVARILGRPQRTFARQMQKFRQEMLETYGEKIF